MICTFGEILLRLSPALERRWIRDASMSVYVGGAELNVAGALAGWRVPVRFCSRMPDHYLSAEILETLQELGIQTAVQLGGSRLGTYYLPQGTDLKQGGVIYDRAYSSFFELRPGMLHWPELLNGCNRFHWSAISPALNAGVADACLEAIEYAVSAGIPVSVDLNYRASLWKYGKPPAEVMSGMVQHADVIMGNLWSAEQLLGIPAPVSGSAGMSKEALVQAAASGMDALRKEYSKVKVIAYTFRMEKTYFAVMKFRDHLLVSKEFVLQDVVDKVGSGDCFMAGLLYGLRESWVPQQIVDFASSAAVGKMQERGDFTRQSVEQILNRINS